MLRAVLVCAFAALALAQVPQPKFPQGWTATEESDVVLAQGSTPGPDGAFCCSPKSNCKVQTEFEAGTHYWDGAFNRTRFDGGGQIIVTLYRIHKQMLVSANLTCQEYCPTEEDTLDPSPFWADADELPVKDLGKTTIDGVEVEHFQWFDKIGHLIKMQETDMYIQLSADPNNYSTPVHETDIIEPFGQQLGTEDTAWTNFVPGTPDASLFAVTGIQECPESQNCNSAFLQHRRLRDRAFRSYAKYAQAPRN